jgi:cytochrome c
MSRSFRVQIGFVILIALTVLTLILISIRNASGSEGTTSEGHRLAEAWCRPCHAIEPHMAGISNQAPSFEAIANRHGTTALSLNVFLKTNHENMPNLVIVSDDADALANYTLSLRTN